MNRTLRTNLWVYKLKCSTERCSCKICKVWAREGIRANCWLRSLCGAVARKGTTIHGTDCKTIFQWNGIWEVLNLQRSSWWRIPMLQQSKLFDKRRGPEWTEPEFNDWNIKSAGRVKMLISSGWLARTADDVVFVKIKANTMKLVKLEATTTKRKI